MIIRDGRVAVQHRTTNPTSVKVEQSGEMYTFVPRNNVSLSWVKEEDLEKVLSIKTKTCECNGGTLAPKFFVASEINVNIHEKGTY